MNNSRRRFELQIILRRASVVILNLGLNKLAVEAPKCVSKRNAMSQALVNLLVAV
jgi:hypothetical protein